MGTINLTMLGRNYAKISASSKAPGDCIDDRLMEEIIRRLEVMVDASAFSDIVRSEKAPTDTSKIWYQPSTKMAFAFDVESNSWQETSISGDTRISGVVNNLIRMDESGAIFTILSASERNLLTVDEEGNILLEKGSVPERFDTQVTSDGSGEGEVTVTFTKFDDKLAAISVMPLEDLGENARWWVAEQTDITAKLAFAGLANSTTFDIAIVATPTTD